MCVIFEKSMQRPKTHYYPLLYMEEIIDEVGGHEIYSFIGFWFWVFWFFFKKKLVITK